MWMLRSCIQVSTFPLRMIILKKLLVSQRYRWLTVLSFALLAWASWAKLGHLMIDFGREVETSARVADGQILYRDIQCYYGPLAYYLNALAFQAFGRNLEVFFATGLTLAAVGSFALYRLIANVLDERWAWLCCLAILSTCSFAPGSINLALPFPAAYGVVCTLLALESLQRQLATPHRHLIWMGLVSGLAFLAKPEYGVAIGGALLLVLLLEPFFRPRPPDGKSLLANAILFFLPPITVCVAVFAWFAQFVGWHSLIFESLLPLQKAEILNHSAFFQVSAAETLEVWGKTFAAFCLTATPLAILVAVGKQLRQSAWRQVVLAVALGYPLLIVLARWTHWTNLPLLNLHCLLPLCALAVFWYRPITSKIGSTNTLLALAVFADTVLLNLRWLFSVEAYGVYGALLPVLLCLVLGFYEQAKSWQVAPFYAACALTMTAARVVEFSHYGEPVSSMRGTLLSAASPDPYLPLGTPAAFQQALDFLERNLSPDERGSVLVLPEGNLLNFLSNTRSPTKQVVFLPGILANEAEEKAFVKQMEQDGLRYVVLIERPFPEWDYKVYSKFNPIVYHWITDKQAPVAVFPVNKPLIRIYKRPPLE
jgi:4-amino-4-deoxy-L-arabinose transferase-like glycosyltransferase